jgi:hypothetical protein
MCNRDNRQQDRGRNHDKTLAYGKRDPTRWLTDEWGGHAYGLRSGSDLSFADGATFKGIVNLGDAKIDGKVDIGGSRFEGKLNAEALRSVALWT